MRILNMNVLDRLQVQGSSALQNICVYVYIFHMCSVF